MGWQKSNIFYFLFFGHNLTLVKSKIPLMQHMAWLHHHLCQRSSLWHWHILWDDTSSSWCFLLISIKHHHLCNDMTITIIEHKWEKLCNHTHYLVVNFHHILRLKNCITKYWKLRCICKLCNRLLGSRLFKFHRFFRWLLVKCSMLQHCNLWCITNQCPMWWLRWMFNISFENLTKIKLFQI